MVSQRATGLYTTAAGTTAAEVSVAGGGTTAAEASVAGAGEEAAVADVRDEAAV